MNLSPRKQNTNPVYIPAMSTTTFTKQALGVDPVGAGLDASARRRQYHDLHQEKAQARWAKTKKKDIPAGLWTKCPSCETMIFDKELDDNLKVCLKCDHHFVIGARERIHSMVETTYL